ncbi:hypothetical protein NPIL_152901 [Nephila pilipes]|uniref:Uncharacterized protein n=1 Tax=Nephila pilipes TaxID=299642 RepID=A0A8X6QLC2_NEPPI|nr:hypothetical protein NPIL_152901 [Nephila pilipes]
MIVDTKQMEFTFDAMNRRGNWPFCFTGTLLNNAEETVWLSLKLWFGKGDEQAGIASSNQANYAYYHNCRKKYKSFEIGDKVIVLAPDSIKCTQDGHLLAPL